MLYQPSANSLPPEARFDPNAFQKRNRAGVAAVRIFSDGDFREASRRAVGGFCDKAPTFATGKQLVDRRGMRLQALGRPKRSSHFCPHPLVGGSHVPDREFHTRSALTQGAERFAAPPIEAGR